MRGAPIYQSFLFIFYEVVFDDIFDERGSEHRKSEH
jgi:hypothetical protein